ncbi:MAG: hypothetical protein K6E56_01820 [Lachnospiraceae bacterium]|nr:hypothetical protein [Lachnospiraceae bacterium]
MDENQLFPFERNRYYAGKMLTSADFVAEQKYFLDKQRFKSALMFGSGVVCGFGVVSLDDLSILIESGVALDGLGREIVIENSIVKKLSAIDGFDSLSSGDVTLCLRYSEKPAHTVYSPIHSDSDKEYEYNRITEGYELYLCDTADLMDPFEMESEFLIRENLFSTKNYTAELIMPSTVCRGLNVKIVVRFTKRSTADAELNYSGVLQIPGFESTHGDHEVEIGVNGLNLSKGESYDFEYWVKVSNTDALDTNIILRSGSAKGTEDGEEIPVDTNLSVRISIEDTTPLKLVTKKLGQMSLEMRSVGASTDYIKLAKLKLVRTESAYVIEEVIEKDIKQYVSVPADDLKRGDLLEFFNKRVDVRDTPAFAVKAPVSESLSPVVNGIEYTTGLVEIPLGFDAKEGDICYSGEIVHGLGNGNVYVEVGYEYISGDESLGQNAKSTIYGNATLFNQPGIAKADTAVKVLNDKGSFVVAAKLLEDANLLVLTYRWVAIRFPSGTDSKKIKTDKNMRISAETPTFVMGARENHYFGIVYHNMEPASISYELTEAGSGEISADGIYTAPSKEGVYEIRIYCTDMPEISTYAYAIVKKKDYNGEDE